MPKNRRNGFTIIEVMIVLAVAGLILAMVFLVVPSAQRSARNYHRRAAVAQVFAAFGEYVQNNNNTYPNSLSTMCDFVNNAALKSVNSQTDTCVPTYDAARSCVYTKGVPYSFCYRDRFASHDYFGDPDEIVLQQGHWCGSDPSNHNEYPITDISGYDSTHDAKYYKYAVYTQLEGTKFVTCVGTQS